MRLKKVQTKNTVPYAIMKDITKNGKRTTCVHENLGTLDKIKIRRDDMAPLVWLEQRLIVT